MMMKLRCLLIDDEPDSIAILEKIISDFCGDEAVVVGSAESMVEGVKLIQRNPVDVLFLDIEMPGGSGFDLIGLLPERNFRLVIVSAYEKHALKAIKVKPFDYLLKPVGIEDMQLLFQAIRLDLKTEQEIKEPAKIKVPIKDGTVFLDPLEISYIKADGRYSSITMKDTNSYLVSKNIGQFEKELSGGNFVRIHKSYLVNVKYIKKISNTDGGFLELLDGTAIEISRRKKRNLLLAMQ